MLWFNCMLCKKAKYALNISPSAFFQEVREMMESIIEHCIVMSLSQHM